MGKTTIAINLAQAFVADGQGVLLVDLDPQGSASDWRSIAPGPAPDFEVQEMERGYLLRQARTLRRQYEVVVIDCPPQYSEPSAAASGLPTLFWCPSSPAPLTCGPRTPSWN